MAAVGYLWGTNGALEPWDEALHPLQPARTIGCDGPWSHTHVSAHVTNGSA